MVFILAYRTQYYIKIELMLYINSKPYIYFMTKDITKPNRYLANL